jgi:hypothetical protein
MSSLSSNCLLNVKTETLSDFNSNLDQIKKLKQEIEKLKAEKQELIDTAVAFINVNDVKKFIYENYQKKYDDDDIYMAIDKICGLGCFDYDTYYDAVYERLSAD